MKTATRSTKRRRAIPHVDAVPHDRPLLEPVDGGWRFTRTPDHWFLTNIPAGAVLKHEPAGSVMTIDGRPLAPWSVHLPGRYKPWGVPESVAIELLMISAIEVDVIRSVRMDEAGDHDARRFCQYALAAAAGEV